MLCDLLWDMEKYMSRIDLLKSSYEAARNEILVRLRIRSQVVSMYLGASGVLLGYMIENKMPPYFVIFINVFTLAVALMLSHHNICIASAAAFCRNELKGKFLGIPMWNNCSVDKRDTSLRRGFRFFSQLFILSFPPIASYLIYLFTLPKMERGSFLLSAESIMSVIVYLSIVGVLVGVRWHRSNKFDANAKSGIESGNV